MPDDKTAADRALLEQTWHERIPLAAAMQLRIVDYDAEALLTRAPADPNRNLHGTAFAGSLYSICALTGWGYVWRLARGSGSDGHIVLSRGAIGYHRPVTGDIACAARADRAAVDDFLARLRAGRTGRLTVTCTIDHDGSGAVEFSGLYHLRPVRNGSTTPRA